jgi:hypothetical protein
VAVLHNPERLAFSRNPLVGVDLVMGKPLNWQELRDAVGKLLRKA